MRNRKIALLLFIIGVVASGYGRTANSLSLEAVLDSVELHYPEVIAAGTRARAQEFLVTRARGSFDPVLSVSLDRMAQGTYQNDEWKVGLRQQVPGTGVKVGVEWGELNGKVPTYEGERNTGSGGRIKGFIEAPILRDLLIDRTRANLQTSILSAAQSLEQARLVMLDTFRLAALSYWSWVANTEKLRVYKNLLRIAEEREKAISSRVQRGEAPKIELVDNHRIIRQRTAQLTKSELETQKASLILSLFYRDSEGQPRQPDLKQAPVWTPSTAKVPNAQLLREALQNHPGVKAIESEAEQKNVAQKLARYNLLPNLDLKAGYTEYIGSLPPPRDQAGEFSFGFKFSFPLFNREARGASSAADMETEATQQKLRLVRQKLEIDFEKSLLEMNAMSTIFRLQVEESSLAQQVEAAERKRFLHGDSSLLNVNLREQDSALAQIRTIDSLLEFKEKDLELHLLTNTWLRKY